MVLLVFALRSVASSKYSRQFDRERDARAKGAQVRAQTTKSVVEQNVMVADCDGRRAERYYGRDWD